MRILAFSDLHRDRAAAERVVAASPQADVVVGAGDFATMGQGLDDCLVVLQQIRAPLVIVAGNHEALDPLRSACGSIPTAHVLHGERYHVTREAWRRIEAAERVLAVGTTTVRVLETIALDAQLEGRTSLYVLPGFTFRRVDALLTNFHLPRSTLLALVMAFAGVEQVRDLYRIAVEERYRFYSFGDAMLIL